MGSPDDDQNETLATVIRLSHGHSGSATPARRGPGRPKKIEVPPTEAALAHHAEIMAERMHHMDADQLVLAMRGRVDAREIVRTVLVDLAREAASLEFQRLELEKRGRDTAQISSRRIDALKKIVEVELKLREIDGEMISLSSEKMQLLFTLWVAKMHEVVTAILPPELGDMFMSRFATAMESFESDAENRLR